MLTVGPRLRILGALELAGPAGPVRLGAAKERCLLAVLALQDRRDPHGGCRLGGVREADGSPLPPAARQRALTMAQRGEPGSFSSLHDDLVAGRRMKLEALHGLVVRRAAEHGVPVPMTEAVYAILKPWAVRNQR